MDESLQTGGFRLVLVLDDAPPELVRLVGYLRAVGEPVLFDLVTASAYKVGDSHVIVPQRIEPEQARQEVPASGGDATRARGYLVEGADDFEAAIDRAPAEERPQLERLTRWARGLEAEGLVRLRTSTGRVVSPSSHASWPMTPTS